MFFLRTLEHFSGIRTESLARILPFAAYISFIFIADMLERVGLSAAQLLWVYPVKIMLVAGLLALCWRNYSELQIGWFTLPVLASSLLVGLIVFLIWINTGYGWMVMGPSNGYDPRALGILFWPMVLVRWLGAALVVPVMEELFWRSYLMRYLEGERFEEVLPSQLKFKSFIITVILFGVEHNLWFAGMLAGLAYGLLYRRYGSLWVPILSHAVTNGVLGVWVVVTSSWSYW